MSALLGPPPRTPDVTPRFASGPSTAAARAAGVLLITATAANLVGSSLSRRLLTERDVLGSLATHAGRVGAGAFLELLAALASPGIAVAIAVVLRRPAPGLALGAVVLRTIEGALYAVAAASLLALLSLSGVGPGAPAESPSGAQVLLALRSQSGFSGVGAFTVGGLLYYAALIRTRRLPRWLAGWGFAAVVVAMVTWIAALAGHQSITDYWVAMLPIGVQEVVMAIWLLVRGFCQPPRRTPAERDPGERRSP